MKKFEIGEMVNYDSLKTEQAIILSGPSIVYHNDRSITTHYQIYSVRRGIFLKVNDLFLWKDKET